MEKIQVNFKNTGLQLIRFNAINGKYTKNN